jgi:hypothetical protein
MAANVSVQSYPEFSHLAKTDPILHQGLTKLSSQLNSFASIIGDIQALQGQVATLISQVNELQGKG